MRAMNKGLQLGGAVHIASLIPATCAVGCLCHKKAPRVGCRGSLVCIHPLAGMPLSSVADGTRGVSTTCRDPHHRPLLVKPKAYQPRRDTQYPWQQVPRQDLETQPSFRRATIKMTCSLVMIESVCAARSL